MGRNLLWYSDRSATYIYKVKTDGTVVSGYDAFAANPRGLTWDGTYLWDADSTAGYIYKVSGGTATYTKIADLVY